MASSTTETPSSDQSNREQEDRSDCDICYNPFHVQVFCPCPARKPNCSGKICRDCMIKGIRTNKRKPPSTFCCHTEVDIQDLWRAVGIANDVHSRMNVDDNGIEVELRREPEGEEGVVPQLCPDHPILANQSCPGIACASPIWPNNRQVTCDCNRVYHLHCLCTVIERAFSQNFICECGNTWSFHA